MPGLFIYYLWFKIQLAGFITLLYGNPAQLEKKKGDFSPLTLLRQQDFVFLTGPVADEEAILPIKRRKV